MAASWSEPKTDWISTDFFNVSDFNRIVGNMYYLYELANDLFEIQTPDLPGNKTFSDFYYAREFNQIEDALENLNLATYNMNFGTKEVFFDNGKFIQHMERNRIERAMLDLCNMLRGQRNNIRRLPFRLGQKGI